MTTTSNIFNNEAQAPKETQKSNQKMQTAQTTQKVQATQTAQTNQAAQAAPAQLPSQNNTMIKHMGENVSTQVLDRVAAMQKSGELVLPKGYEAGNALKSAWLYLQTIETRDKRKAIDVCTKESIANCLMEMVIRGEHPMRHCYFIPTGNQLSFWEKYTGRLMRAKRDTDIKEVNPQVIYDGDNFVYTVDENGKLQLVKHETSLSNIDNSKILGAYAVVINKDGSRHLEVMTIDMIRKAWGQGAARGNSGAHVNFTDQMAKKSIIGRACKVALDSTEDGHNSEDDAYMAMPDEANAERALANNDSDDTKRLSHYEQFEETATYEEVGSEMPESKCVVAADTDTKQCRECPI